MKSPVAALIAALLALGAPAMAMPVMPALAEETAAPRSAAEAAPDAGSLRSGSLRSGRAPHLDLPVPLPAAPLPEAPAETSASGISATFWRIEPPTFAGWGDTSKDSGEKKKPAAKNNAIPDAGFTATGLAVFRNKEGYRGRDDWLEMRKAQGPPDVDCSIRA